jgi:hypothetical protein
MDPTGGGLTNMPGRKHSATRNPVDLHERSRIAWNIVMAFQHFAGKPMLLTNFLADETPLSELQVLEWRLRKVAERALEQGKKELDGDTRKGLAKFGGSVLHTLDMKF